MIRTGHANVRSRPEDQVLQQPKQRVIEVLQSLDLSTLDPADRKIMVGAGVIRLVPQTDGAYDGIRDLVKTLNIDLEKLT